MSKRKFTPPRTFICAFRSELLFMLTRSRLNTGPVWPQAVHHLKIEPDNPASFSPSPTSNKSDSPIFRSGRRRVTGK